MRTAIIATVLALAALLATAPAAASYSSESCGSSVITVGDPITKVRSACGEPWRIVQLQNALGAALGERWEYERTTGMVLFTIQGGRVVRIDRT